MTSAYSVDAQQTTGITESDVLIWAEMMTGTSTPCAPFTIVRTMTGFVGWFLPSIECEN